MYEESIAQLEPVAEAAGSPLTILIVEDDETQIAPLEHRLTRQGYRVAAVQSGAEARDAVTRFRPDLVLLDLRLPDQDGFELCAQLADHPSTCGVPIIVLSALETPDIVRQARSAGGSYYVRKPYDPNVLLTLIEQALREDSQLDWC